jgi:hypothetical protein
MPKKTIYLGEAEYKHVNRQRPGYIRRLVAKKIREKQEELDSLKEGGENV